MNIGSVRANNIEDPDCRDTIRLGFVTGDGLLGEVLKAICKLVDATTEYECRLTETASSKVEEARLNLYDALKAIEKADKS